MLKHPMIKRSAWYGLLVVAGVALWLLLAGAEQVLGFDPGRLGMALLIGCAWAALYGVQSLPRGEFEQSASPGEWKARIGVAFIVIAMVYFLANMDVLTRDTGPDARAVGRQLVMLLIAWAVLSQVVGARWKGQVQQDERDREIATRAAGWGRGALIVCVIGIAVMLGLSPPQRLAWATPLAVAHWLVFALMWGALLEYAATAVFYWRDRRA